MTSRRHTTATIVTTKKQFSKPSLDDERNATRRTNQNQNQNQPTNQPTSSCRTRPTDPEKERRKGGLLQKERQQRKKEREGGLLVERKKGKKKTGRKEQKREKTSRTNERRPPTNQPFEYAWRRPETNHERTPPNQRTKCNLNASGGDDPLQRPPAAVIDPQTKRAHATRTKNTGSCAPRARVPTSERATTCASQRAFQPPI